MNIFKKLFGKKKKEITLNKFIENKVQMYGGVSNAINKNTLEDLMKQYPQSEHPVIVDSTGKLSFTNEKGDTVQLRVPLITIIPIPYIPKDKIDLDKYYKENFGDTTSIKDIKDIKEVKLDIPDIAISPIPPFSDMKKIDLNK